MSTRQNMNRLQLYTEADSPTGVDDFLLLEQLRRTPVERLAWAERTLANVLWLRSNARPIASSKG